MLNPIVRQSLRLATMALLAGGGALASPLARAGDAKAGADVFKSECAECHAVKEGGTRKDPACSVSSAARPEV